MALDATAETAGSEATRHFHLCTRIAYFAIEERGVANCHSILQQMLRHPDEAMAQQD